MDQNALDAVLARARGLGLVGGASTTEHISHSRAMATLLEGATAILDLGSGGGLPGLVVAGVFPQARVVLLDASGKRCDHLRRAVREMGLGARVEVAEVRAENAAHEPALRGRFDAVTARSFGTPALVAECAAGFLDTKGRLVVSEPPGGAADRWSGVAGVDLGLGEASVAMRRGFNFTVIERTGVCSLEVPRSATSMARRPKF